jgi:hypothetical protein
MCVCSAGLVVSQEIDVQAPCFSSAPGPATQKDAAVGWILTGVLLGSMSVYFLGFFVRCAILLISNLDRGSQLRADLRRARSGVEKGRVQYLILSDHSDFSHACILCGQPSQIERRYTIRKKRASGAARPSRTFNFGPRYQGLSK